MAEAVAPFSPLLAMTLFYYSLPINLIRNFLWDGREKSKIKIQYKI